MLGASRASEGPRNVASASLTYSWSCAPFAPEGLPRGGSLQPTPWCRVKVGSQPTSRSTGARPSSPSSCPVLSTRCIRWPRPTPPCPPGPPPAPPPGSGRLPRAAALAAPNAVPRHLLGHGHPRLVVHLEGALCRWPGVLGLGFLLQTRKGSRPRSG